MEARAVNMVSRYTELFKLLIFSAIYIAIYSHLNVKPPVSLNCYVARNVRHRNVIIQFTYIDFSKYTKLFYWPSAAESFLRSW
jgi:hypothetical protein